MAGEAWRWLALLGVFLLLWSEAEGEDSGEDEYSDSDYEDDLEYYDFPSGAFRLLWTTPVFRGSDLQKDAEFNTELATEILQALEDSQSEWNTDGMGWRSHHSNNAFFAFQQREELAYFSGGNLTSAMRRLYDSPAWNRLREEILKWAETYLKQSGYTDRFWADHRPRGKNLSLWATVHQAGMHHKEHHHEGVLVAGTYYVRTPLTAGYFVLSDPRGYQPPFGGLLNWKPSEGDMVLFPGWLKHSVSQTKGSHSAVRIGVAFNLNGPWRNADTHVVSDPDEDLNLVDRVDSWPKVYEASTSHTAATPGTSGTHFLWGTPVVRKREAETEENCVALAAHIEEVYKAWTEAQKTPPPPLPDGGDLFRAWQTRQSHLPEAKQSALYRRLVQGAPWKAVARTIELYSTNYLRRSAVNSTRGSFKVNLVASVGGPPDAPAEATYGAIAVGRLCIRTPAVGGEAIMIHDPRGPMPPFLGAFGWDMHQGEIFMVPGYVRLEVEEAMSDRSEDIEKANNVLKMLGHSKHVVHRVSMAFTLERVGKGGGSGLANLHTFDPPAGTVMHDVKTRRYLIHHPNADRRV